MGVTVLCSGQGGQHPEMFVRLAECEKARPILAAASERLGLDITDLERQADRLDLSANRTAQILITAHSLAVAAALGEDAIELCIGYSVGEIAACSCAGAYGFQTAFDLIERRAAIMDAARDNAGEPQGMLAVIGIPRKAIDEIATSAGAEIAIVNGGDHVVLGGPAIVLDDLERTLAERGARNVRRLPVRVASHTRFMSAAGEAFAHVLREIDWKRPRVPVLSGMDGRPIWSHADAETALAGQLFRLIDFERCLQSAEEQGATVALEIGPCRALVRLTQDILPDLPVRAIEDFKSAESAKAWLFARR
jgi:[acyl-carrier-protein] S-malonyltransferase